MKITALETLSVAAYGNVTWVRVITDEGVMGLGETFRNPEAVSAYIHETCAPYLLGEDPLDVERHAFALRNVVGNHFNGFPTRSVELRGNSAVDIALWDILGKATNLPLYRLLGGKTRSHIKAYNTCAGYQYNNVAQTTADSEIAETLHADTSRPYDDLVTQLDRPDLLAQSLIDQGITAMKIWPFDAYARASKGQEIVLPDLREGVGRIEAIRKAVGDRMEILLECHALWCYAPALQIARAVKDLDLYWIEDPIGMHNLQDLARYAQEAPVTRVAGSESLGTAAWYREAFTRDAVDVANFDIGWIGGITEARKIAALSEAFARAFSPHDCTGPVVFGANSHLLAAAPNALMAEMVRAYYWGYYSEVAEGLPLFNNGHLIVPETPGHGVVLAAGIERRPDCRRRISSI